MNYHFTKEDGIATSTEKIAIENLHQAVNLWIYTEGEDFPDFSPKQRKALESFQRNPHALTELTTAVQVYYEQCLAEKVIQPATGNAFVFTFEAVVLPSQAETADLLLFVLINTQWQLTNSDCTMELEAEYRNGSLVDLSELSGQYVFLY